MTTSIYYIQLKNEIKSETNINLLESFEYEIAPLLQYHMINEIEIAPLLQYHMINEIEFNELLKLAEDIKRKIKYTKIGDVL